MKDDTLLLVGAGVLAVVLLSKKKTPVYNATPVYNPAAGTSYTSTSAANSSGVSSLLMNLANKIFSPQQSQPVTSIDQVNQNTSVDRVQSLPDSFFTPITSAPTTDTSNIVDDTTGFDDFNFDDYA